MLDDIGIFLERDKKHEPPTYSTQSGVAEVGEPGENPPPAPYYSVRAA